MKSTIEEREEIARREDRPSIVSRLRGVKVCLTFAAHDLHSSLTILADELQAIIDEIEETPL